VLAPALTGLHLEALQAQDKAQNIGRRIVATSSLASKEYAEGVVEGRVVLPEEVGEARLFLTEARTAARELPADLAARTIATLDSMLTAVDEVGDPVMVAALADGLAEFLGEELGGLDEQLPSLQPDVAFGRGVYAATCSTCHGDQGTGDGVAALGLDPPPSDLTDGTALADQTPLDFYRKVLIGVSGTAMPRFEDSLSTEEIWAVARYATGFRFRDGDVADGERLFWELCVGCTPEGTQDWPWLARLPGWVSDPGELAMRTDEELAAEVRKGALGGPADSASAAAVVAYLRTEPFAFSGGDDVGRVLGGVRTELARGLRAAKDGDYEVAATKMFDSYVVFEAVEADVALRDNALVGELEFAFSEMRGLADARADLVAMGEGYANLDGLLARAESTLGEETSEVGLFTQSFILLLREGVEAMLIVGALAALVMRAGAADRKREIGWGVGLALVASLVTAVLFETVFRVGVAQREMLEGGTMLVAAAVLLFVSYWLISKIEVRRWKDFVSGHGQRAVRDGSMFALGLAAFLAVYREGFETILFYKALFITAGGGGVASVTAGGLAAAAVLVVLYVGMTRFGLRIPIRPFFAATSVVLMYMSFTFAGKGIAELQESSLISTTLLDWAPHVPWMGIYPTTQSMVLQAGILTLILAGLIWTFLVAPRVAQRTSRA
jgi:high-affinity iron transporter